MSRASPARRPEGWKGLRLKLIAEINPDVLPEDTTPNTKIQYVDIGGVTYEEGIKVKQDLLFGDAPSRARRKVRHGDVIVSTVRTYLKAVAPVISPPDNLIVSTGFAVLRPRSACLSAFLAWAVKGKEFVEAVVAESVGVSYPAIAPSILGTLTIDVPPMCEQRAIAQFLDRETAKIDLLIAKQSEFITRLGEHERALVATSTACGIDASAPMQTTSSEVFSSIPAHWIIKPLMRLVPPDRPINYGVLMPGPSMPEGVPLIEAGDVMAGPIVPSALRHTTHEIEMPFARSRLKPGDVVVAIRGSIGAAEIVPDNLTEANVTRDAARVSPNADVVPKFLAYVIGSPPVRAHFESKSLGSAVQGINISDLKRVPIPLPPLSEQIAIVQYLEETLAKLQAIRSASREMVERLREHRAALIAAAVTGHIDVRSTVLSQAAE